MDPKFRASPMWDKINSDFIGDVRNADLTNFRRSEINSRISTWDYRTNGARYLKTLIYCEASRLSERQWNWLRNIANTDFGNPISIRMHGMNVSLDYLVAAYEIDFLERHLAGVSGILEIGAGFGRTCHSILSNFPAIAGYTIVDLPACLELSRRYLDAVLAAELFAKIRFVPNSEAGALREDYGLAINIDSMNEMDASVVDAYLQLIAARASLFYTNNALGKYLPADLEDTQVDPASLERAMSSGKLRQVVPIFDADRMQEHVPAFLEAYRPGADWSVVDHGWPRPWTYFHHALYRRA